jgi:hypothetical protein
MSDKVNQADEVGENDQLTPQERAVLARVVRAMVITEADLVTSWGTGPWASEALEGLLKRGLVNRLENVDQMFSGLGLPKMKPGPYINSTDRGRKRMSVQDVGFPPSGTWLLVKGVPLNDQPRDLLLQLIEYYMAMTGMKVGPGAEAPVLAELERHLFDRLARIKRHLDSLEEIDRGWARHRRKKEGARDRRSKPGRRTPWNSR